MKQPWRYRLGPSIAVLVLLLLGCEAAPAPLPVEVFLQATFEIPELVEGQPISHPQMNYLLYLPRDYNEQAERLWPVILYLHGSGSGENDSAFVMSTGLPEVLYTGGQPEEFPFIVVCPQAFPDAPWWEEDEPAIVMALLDDAIERYHGDPDRVYLTGLSMGGYGSWYLAAQYPERFAAMASTSGSGFRTLSVPKADVLCQLAGVPVWAFHGARDQISDPNVSQLFASTLEARCGNEVRWTLYPDDGHLSTAARAYRDPDLYRWLLEHSRQPN